MRVVPGILFVATFLLSGCYDGHETSSEWTPPPQITAFTSEQKEPFDYFGPLMRPGTVLTGSIFGTDWRPPDLAECIDGRSEILYASCVDSVTIDGFPADFSDLEPGKIVEIHGERVKPSVIPLPWPVPNAGLPRVSIDIKRAVVGPVEEVDVKHAFLIVLGQRVYRYAPGQSPVSVGDMVAVYGHTTTDGEILAERVEPIVGSSMVLLRGLLAEPSPGRFTTGGVELDLSGAAREGFPGGSVLAGDSVLILANRPPQDGVLSVATIRCVGQCVSQSWVSGAVRGIVTAWRSPTDFDVNGVTIRPQDCDCSEGEVRIGSYVDVALFGGAADIAPVVPDIYSLAVGGRISEIDSSSHVLVALGYRIQVTPATWIQESENGEEPLAFEDLQPGDVVTASGEPLGEVLSANTLYRGPMEPFVSSDRFSIEPPEIAIGNRRIGTHDETTVTFNRCYDYVYPISLPDFFAHTWEAEPGARLRVRVEPDTDSLVAKDIYVYSPVCDY